MNEKSSTNRVSTGYPEGFRVEAPHIKGCWALEPEHAPLHSICSDDGHVYRDKSGGNRGGKGYRWLRFRCNNIECTGRVIVRANVIADWIYSQMSGGRRGK